MAKLVHTVLDYDERGPWGSASYHGNTSGYIIRDLAETFEAKRMLDPMEGSGTARDVAKMLGIEYFGYDLNGGHDIMNVNTQRVILHDIGEQRVDFIFWHPPYWNMVMYHPTDPRDFSSGPYVTYLVKMQQALKFLRNCLATVVDSKIGRTTNGGFPRLAILIGDVRYQGKFYWLARDLTARAKLHDAGFQLENVLIRRQRGVSSNALTYQPRDPLIRLMHETILLLEPLGN